MSYNDKKVDIYQEVPFRSTSSKIICIMIFYGVQYVIIILKKYAFFNSEYALRFILGRLNLIDFNFFFFFAQNTNPHPLV